MKKFLSGFISILLSLTLVWQLCPVTAFAVSDEDLTATWDDGLDGYFLAVSEDVELGNVYRSCPYVRKTLEFFWSQDGDPANRQSDVMVEAVPPEGSPFRYSTEGNSVTIIPDADWLPAEDGYYSEYAVIRLSLGEASFEEAERKRETELYVSMDLQDGDAVFEISDAEDLKWFASLVEQGYTDIGAVLCDDIVLNQNVLDADGRLIPETDSLKTWTPIGSSNAYEGEFDGDGHSISGIYIDTEEWYAGLFGELEGTVKNLRIRDSWIRSGDSAGAAAGWTKGTIVCVSANAYVSAPSAAGGIAGVNDEEISRCFTTGTAELYDANETGENGEAGPVCGTDNGTIESTYYLSEEETDEIEGTEAKSAAQFASGEVCWLLNDGLDEAQFFQDLGEEGDPVPVLDPEHKTVYRGYTSCADAEPVYANEWLEEEPISHWLTWHEETESSCGTQGNTEYWSCEVCGRYFGDADGTEEIEEGSWILPAAAHVLTAHEGQAPTCTEDGSAAYYSCEICGRYFQDEGGLIELGEDQLILPAAAQMMTEFHEKTPSC